MQEGTILMCGATGNVGSTTLARLAASSQPVRALIRPGTETRHIHSLGVQVAVGDVRDPDSVRRGLSGVSIVACAVTAMSRYMAGDHTARIRDVDLLGVRTLVDLAEEEGVERFVYVSFPSVYGATQCPLVSAGMSIERRLDQSTMTTVIVRAEPYAELWLTPAVGFDPGTGAVRIYGRGTQPIRFTSTTDVGEAVARLAVVHDPPAEIELAAGEAMSLTEAADRAESLTGRRSSRRYIPRFALGFGAHAFRRLRPEHASAMSLGLALDTIPSQVTPGAFEALGIQPSTASEFLARRYGTTAAGARRPSAEQARGPVT